MNFKLLMIAFSAFAFTACTSFDAQSERIGNRAESAAVSVVENTISSISYGVSGMISDTIGGVFRN